MEPRIDSDVAASEASALHLPRILCLHGGGTNARIFATQCRSLLHALKAEFRLVFAEAAFPSQAGPDVTAVYGEWGPFRRWIRWLPQHPVVGADDVVRALDESLRAALRRDDARGATGECVALLGFSQGAKIAASLLYRQQLRDDAGLPEESPRFRFAVIMAGSAPLVALDPALCPSPALPDASQTIEYKYAGPPLHVIRVPTLHVHGLLDPGLERHRQLLEDFCDPQTRALVEWEGEHRLPLKQVDVAPIVCHIRRLARQTGVYDGV
ncbi:hypothetical protein XA68_12652 [Ophiocordyceps unilateralis]|uniref:Serine hydrolase domain-containing protein n=1 Tax=Ophiocordyceps unilateralis TaxID=268505 RepID=A0A2A9PDY1_OPHUN|nr:hypothetical protein XA68_12652 [Ophiocordyceps unilateralis]